MKFDIKHKISDVLNSFRIKIKMGHGDADLHQELNLGFYKQEDLFIVVGIINAIKEMKASDEKSNNDHLYDDCPNFRRFLKEHWKYDVFTQNSDYRYYAYVSEYAVFYINENGIEYEVENVQCDDEPKNHYYLKLESGRRFHTFFGEWDVITTYQPLDEKTIKQWRLVEIPNGSEFLLKHSFKEVTIDPEDLEEDRDYLITGHFEPAFETEEQEGAFWDAFDELKGKAIFQLVNNY